ncbi:MAG: SpoIIE family protein phosphatase [Bacteroidetes bacterium]|nr:SpoIIE family protein phosphatase [Bacteroidota bacterium]
MKTDKSAEYRALEQQTGVLLDISGQIMTRKPHQELLKDIIDCSKSLLSAEASSLLLYNEAEERLHFHLVEGGSAEVIKTRSLALGEGTAGWVAQQREPLHLPDCHADPRFNANFDKITGFRTRNMICTPMLYRDRLVGVIQVMNKANEEAFTPQDVRFLGYLAGQCAIAIENNRLVSVEIESKQLSAELETARNIQQKTLPSSLPEISGVSIDFRLIPARQLGGDYYNVVRIDENKHLFIIADVSGKSVPAALIVASVHSFLQTYLIVKGTDFQLTDFVQSLNAFLCTSTTSDKFVTAWFGLYDATTCSLESISAGHEPCYLYRADTRGCEILSAGGLLLGMMNMLYQSEIVTLQKGDMLLCYTDGITEAMNSEDEEFGVDPMLSAASAEWSKGDENNPASAVVQSVLDHVKDHRGIQLQSDDITLGVLVVV